MLLRGEFFAFLLFFAPLTTFCGASFSLFIIFRPAYNLLRGEFLTFYYFSPRLQPFAGRVSRFLLFFAPLSVF